MELSIWDYMTITFLMVVIQIIINTLFTYGKEKGKNLATKEDIAEITQKVEYVKSQFGQKHIRSKAFIEKQINAYDEIDVLLYDFRGHFFNKREKGHDLNFFQNLLYKSNDSYSNKMINLNEKHSIYISEEIDKATAEFVGKCIDFGELNDLNTAALEVTRKALRSNEKAFFEKHLEEMADQAFDIRNKLKSELMND